MTVHLRTPTIGGNDELLRELSDWIAVAASRARRTASVCSGTFLLAQAGLLNGKRAATHWAMCDLLQERFPAIDIDRDSLFVRQEAVWTSAGVTAGIDQALSLVEGDCGHEVAMQVARLYGFGNEERLRTTFQRTLGVSPSDYRKRFAPSEMRRTR